ncbi:MAG TPA: ABC transporter ATP-binding protein [Aggregatilineales bacterium]|nr:ABC transporter ATP-binding protein [Aggregatilineales bacterium]HPV06730.1 ABC transporter ATP-binding protein [Aggregatilineales bacterium]
MSDVAIEVTGLGKRYRIGGPQERYKRFTETVMHTLSAPVRRLRRIGQPPPPEEMIWALRDVSFEVGQGEVVGIIGRNGAGKSTLLKIISRITEPTEGRVRLRGRVGSLLEVGTGFHPELTGRENIYLNGAILGMTRAEIERKFDEIVDFAEIEKFIDTPVKRYSSGMYVRLAFAVAAHLEPEILLVDEVLAVGDAAFQKKCLGKMGDVAGEGRTVLFVSHNMGAIQSLTRRTLVIDRGRLVADTDTATAVQQYLSTRNQPTEAHAIRSRHEAFRVDALRFNYDLLESGFNRPLTFEIDVTADRPLHEVSVALSAVNSLGARLLTSERTLPRLPAGKSRLQVTIADHRLPPGNYNTIVGILIGGVTAVYEENVLPFELSDVDVDNAFIVKRRDRIGAFIPAQIRVLEPTASLDEKKWLP